MIADRSIVRAAHIILASSSPRRVDILNNVLGLQAEVIPSTFPEDLDKSRFTPAEYVAENAKQKALEVYSRLRAKGETRSLIVGADTVVVRDGAILEKPTSKDHAVQMLQSLSGRSHTVSTGVALVYAPSTAHGAVDEAPHVHTFVETTSVTFAPISPESIGAYVESGEPSGGWPSDELLMVSDCLLHQASSCSSSALMISDDPLSASLIRRADGQGGRLRHSRGGGLVL